MRGASLMRVRDGRIVESPRRHQGPLSGDFKDQPGELERAKGIEPSYAAWEAAVLPLNYARDLKDLA